MPIEHEKLALRVEHFHGCFKDASQPFLNAVPEPGHAREHRGSRGCGFYAQDGKIRLAGVLFQEIGVHVSNQLVQRRTKSTEIRLALDKLAGGFTAEPYGAHRSFAVVHLSCART